MTTPFSLPCPFCNHTVVVSKLGAAELEKLSPGDAQPAPAVADWRDLREVWPWPRRKSVLILSHGGNLYMAQDFSNYADDPDNLWSHWAELPELPGADS